MPLGRNTHSLFSCDGFYPQVVSSNAHAERSKELASLVWQLFDNDDEDAVHTLSLSLSHTIHCVLQKQKTVKRNASEKLMEQQKRDQGIRLDESLSARALDPTTVMGFIK